MHAPSRLALIALLTTGAMAQEAVNLDAVDSAAAAAPAPKHHGGMRMGDVSVGLFFDGYLEYKRPSDSQVKHTLEFGQQHQSLLARAATPEGIVVFADVIHWENVFEATVPFNFFVPAVKDIPGLDKGSIRFGRILIPFGDFAGHPIYGGSVVNSEIIRNQFWSDYGASVKLPFGDKVETEIYAVNGIQAVGDSSVRIASTWESNFSKAVGARLKIFPTPGTFVAFSGYQDYLNTPAGTHEDSAWAITTTMAGLDAGIRTGPVSFKAGGMVARTASKGFHDYLLSGWYAETRYRLNDIWSLRLRGGQVDPDNRVKNDDDQTNVNASVLWQKGPLDVGLTWYHNLETHWMTKKTAPMNGERIRLETFVSL